MSQIKQAKMIEFQNAREELTEVFEAAEKMLKDNHNILVGHPEAAGTVAFVVMQCMFQWLDKNKDASHDVAIDFGGLFRVGVTNREGDEDEEKDGNFVPFMEPGQVAKSLIKSDEETEDED